MRLKQLNLHCASPSVLGSERRDGKHNGGGVDALFVGQSAAHHHLAGHTALLVRGLGRHSHGGVGHDHLQLSVVQQQSVAYAQGVQDLRVGQAHTLVVASNVLEVKAERLPFFQVNLRIDENSNTEFRPLNCTIIQCIVKM